jgi:hypothetical protein
MDPGRLSFLMRKFQAFRVPRSARRHDYGQGQAFEQLVVISAYRSGGPATGAALQMVPGTNSSEE